MTARPRGWVPLAAAFAWLVCTIWLRPLSLPDEGRYGGVAWEMVRSGQWLWPTLDGLPYFHKPPLFYWITATALQVFGLHPFATRIAPLIGAMLAATAVYLFARRWAGERFARIALAVLATAPIFFLSAQYANLDMLVAGCISACVLSVAHAVLTDGQDRRAVTLGWLFAALGLLAKGLIGLVLPGMVVVAWIALTGRWRVLPRLFSVPALLVFAVIAAPWFVAMQMRFPEFMHYFFVVQHFQRFSGGGFNNAQPWWFYLAVLALLALPWTPWLAGIRRGFFGDPERGHVRLLMLTWAVLITIFFSLPRSKIVGYILPVLAPFAWLIADALEGACITRPARVRVARACAGLAVAICLCAVGVAAWKADVRQRDIGEALRRAAGPNDEIVFVGDYFFALSFYGRLRHPVRVADEWTREAAMARDNWRRELFDAGEFAPSAGVLIGIDKVPAVACGPQQTWLVAYAGTRQRAPWLDSADVVAKSGDLLLLRVPAGAGGTFRTAQCPGKPSANSAGT